QNFHPESEEGINKQINTELYAFYNYLSLAYYFQRYDVALPGFHKTFKKRSQEELEHAQMFMEYQNQRGGSIVLQPLNKPSKDKWGTTVEAMEV
ncbi:ferritin family protein, partial [Salmonella sp. s54836]|uniref:ferritin family protein n=1 Tax=Salmonella sp. s54836 TaxID=3159673 RepID=UPI0039800A48